MDTFSFGKVFCILFLAVVSVKGADDPTADPSAASTVQPPVTKAVDVVTHLRVTTLLDPPFVMMSARGERFRGLMVDILRAANNKIGYDTVDISINDEATFGGEEKPGAWTGLIGALQNESADIAMGAVSVTASRSKVVVFTQPVLTAGYRVLYKIPEAWNPGEAIVTVLRPFTPGLWVLIVLMFVVTSLSLYAIGRYSPYEDIAFVSKTATFEGLTLPNSLLYTFSTLVWQGYTAAPKSISGRILTCMWWVFSVFTVGAYIAGLVVILFRVNPEIRTLPFSNLDEMTRQTKVGIMVVKDSSAYRYLSTAHNSLEKRLFGLMTANADSLVVASTQEGIDKMLKSDGAFALLMEAPAAEYLATQEPCNKMVIGEAVGSHYYSFACRNTSDVCQKMDTEILRMKEEGWLDQQKERWFKTGCMKKKGKAYVYEGLPFFDTFGGEPDLIMPMTITIQRFSAAFIFLVIGIIISAVCLAVEIFYARRRGTAVPRKLNPGGVDEDMERIDNDFHDDAHASTPSHRFGI